MTPGSYPLILLSAHMNLHCHFVRENYFYSLAGTAYSLYSTDVSSLHLNTVSLVYLISMYLTAQRLFNVCPSASRISSHTDGTSRLSFLLLDFPSAEIPPIIYLHDSEKKNIIQKQESHQNETPAHPLYKNASQCSLTCNINPADECPL